MGLSFTKGGSMNILKQIFNSICGIDNEFAKLQEDLKTRYDAALKEGKALPILAETETLLLANAKDPENIILLSREKRGKNFFYFEEKTAFRTFHQKIQLLVDANLQALDSLAYEIHKSYPEAAMQETVDVLIDTGMHRELERRQALEKTFAVLERETGVTLNDPLSLEFKRQLAQEIQAQDKNANPGEALDALAAERASAPKYDTVATGEILQNQSKKIAREAALEQLRKPSLRN